jgi:hypothetical protein
VQRDSASCIEWVVRVIAAFLSLRDYVRVFQRNLLAIGSTPDEGSSKNYISGPPIRAMVTQSFLLFPPESFSLATFS